MGGFGRNKQSHMDQTDHNELSGLYGSIFRAMPWRAAVSFLQKEYEFNNWRMVVSMP